MKKQNEKLIKNMELYDKKKEAEQQKSKILGQKQVKKTRGKEKGTRMYHL